ncbi:MAG: Rrf2 family transcriptional regulator [Bacteroidetes bacterium]|nr:Rrf2 family transcriptional regulator [Bacteroidota bacterium]
MLLSKSCIYGIRAAIYVASVEGNQFMSIRQIANKLDISFHFLTKILQTLTLDGIMNSYRGPNGGIMLARDANSIMLIDLVKALDGDNIFRECFLGLENCGNSIPCPLHEHWANIRKNITIVLTNTSLSELASKVSTMEHRLSEKDIFNNF